MNVKERAFGDIPLLDAVVAFKRKFYRCNWAHYELATAAAISLMPPEHALLALESDYRHMQNMIFGPRPPFSEIVDMVRNLEAESYQRADLLFRQKDAGDMPQRRAAVRTEISRMR